MSLPVAPRQVPGAAGPCTRRAALAAAGVVAAGVAGCSGSAGGDKPAGAAGRAGSTTGSTADIPVGGGRVFPAQKVVVTQPAPGSFQAFSAVCTHQGCTVLDVQANVIQCPCHGSRFSGADGSVVQGPAQRPLTRLPITVSGGSFTAGEP